MINFSIFYKFIALLALLMITGCASVLSDNHYPIEVKSYPLGADFSITDVRGNLIAKGVTPEIVPLYSGGGYFQKAEYKVLFEKEGYEKEIRELKSKVDEMYFANFTNILGFFAVDPAGAMYELPDSIYAILKEIPKPVAPPEPVIQPYHYHRPIVYRRPVVRVAPVAPVVPMIPVTPSHHLPPVEIPHEHHEAPQALVQPSAPAAVVEQIITPIREKTTTYRTDEVETIEHSETHFVPCTKESQPCQ